MNVPTPTDTDRGQVGIGTLIIFIALVLVAAVAAGVLVNTAGDLQSRAADTGADAQAQVSNQIDVVAATGTDSDDGGNVDTLTFLVKKSAGSGPIDLSEATVQYTSDSDAATLTSSNFDVLTRDGSSATDTVLSESSERRKIEIELTGTDPLPPALESGDSADVQFIDQSGASTTYGVNMPDVFSGSVTQV